MRAVIRGSEFLMAFLVGQFVILVENLAMFFLPEHKPLIVVIGGSLVLGVWSFYGGYCLGRRNRS